MTWQGPEFLAPTCSLIVHFCLSFRQPAPYWGLENRRTEAMVPATQELFVPAHQRQD